MVEIFALAVFAGLLIYAAGSDIARLIIPNWVSIALAGAFPIAAFAAGMAPAEIGMHLLFGAAMLAIAFFLFAANVFGGGDAKLIAAACVWTGFQGFLPLLFWTATAGGLMAAALLAARQFVRAETSPPLVSHLLQKQNGIPYGVAIMAGGLMAIPTLPFVLAR